ncbi:hypothetical protein AWB75_04746 [Caballeronia catudaia]|uniref:Uncharacterized protein n=2 Tax=Caballeronia catudaia TaxID=1777136 RepID=A0A158C9H0_9BURK|nr:hypothetical protein AWB75_04746 [Caballeronia catudaia]
MVRMVELIERDYHEAREAGRLGEWGAMPLLDSEELVLVSKESLEKLSARVEEVERELDERKLEESLAWFRSRGYTEDKLLSPEDLVTRSDASPAAEPVRLESPKSSLLDLFGGYFAKRMKQAG